jgi:GMP synthase-like glutamine amidotransferase
MASPGPAPAKARFAVLDCEDAVKWDGHAIALARLLGRAGETWEHHRCWSGELPDLRDIHTYQGLVVTGSHYCVRDEHAHEWIGALKRFIAKVVVHGGVKVYGACFGCQVIAEALGGKVDANPCGLPFVLKRETVVLTEAMTNRPEYELALAAFPPTALSRGGAASEKKNSAKQARLAVLQAHGDVVVSLPNGAVLLAHSETAPCEMFALGEDVLAVQGHPELDGATMLEKIAPFARALSEDDRAAAKSSLRLETDHVSVVGIVRAFLRGFSSSDDGDRGEEKIIEKDTLESLRRHTEAARAALADAPPRGKDGLFSRPDATADAKKAGSASSAASGAAALSAGAASVTSTPNISATTNALSPLSESSKNANNARLAERQLVVAAEDAFACAARGAEAEVRAMSFEFATLAKVNRAAAEKYAELGCTVAGLGVFADSLRRKDANAAPRFAELDVIEQNLDALENAAAALEAEAERLETRAAAVRLLAAKRKTLSLDEKVGLLESGGGGSNEA